MEVVMVAENSGIKDKSKLLKYLYTHPEKMAMKLAQYINDDEESYPMVQLKGTGQGWYRSVNHKTLVRVSREEEFYLLPWEDKDDKKKCYIYTHFNWMSGLILNVYRDDIEFIGYN